MQKILTISIAAYNMEAYLEECLNSFIDERLNETLEVLIINDGSTDKTAEIAERYVRQNPAIFRLITKENGGHGSTINRGIKEAAGKYYRPVDGDDWVNAENLLTAIEYIKNLDVDIILTDHTEYYSKTKDIKRISPTNMKNPNTVQTFDLNSSIIMMHQIIYKTSILQKNSITLSENLFYADTEFNLYPIPYISTLIYIPLEIYCWRQEREGQSVSIEGKLRHKTDMERIIFNLFHFYRKNKQQENKKKFYALQVKNVLSAHIELTYLEPWLKTGKEYKRENQLFYFRLLLISPGLFLSHMVTDKIRLIRLMTWFGWDRQLYKLRSLYKKCKERFHE